MIRGYIKRYRLELVNFAAGFAVLTFELAATRIIAPYIGTTIYTWTSIIGVILASLAGGYALGGYLADKRKRLEDIVTLLLIAAAAILIVNLTKDWSLAHISGNSLSIKWQSLFASILLFAVPTVLLGAVSPYLTRMNLSVMETSGSKIARISAAGAIGSLAGVFLTGYVLFDYIGTKNILSLLAIILVISSFLLGGKLLFLTARIALLLAAALAILWAPKPHVIGLIKDTDSKYSRIQIADGVFGTRPARVLMTDNLALQSGVFLDGSKDLAFSYIRALSYAAQLNSQADKYLVIGGGTFTLPQYLARQKTNARVDVVELDDKLPAISREYFGFNPPNNLGLFLTDGREYLNHNRRQYDMVILDAFNNITPPFQLFTKEAADHIYNSLSPEGALAANVVSATEGPRSGMIKAIIATYSQIFPEVRVFRCSPYKSPQAEQNLILVASKSGLSSSDLRRAAGVNEESSKIFSGSVSINTHGAKVLSDDFAPVEKLATSEL